MLSGPAGTQRHHRRCDQTTLQVPLGKPFQTVAIHLESRVRDKLKAKIWRNECLDFGLLLFTNHEDPKYAVSVSSEQDLGHAKLWLEPVRKPKRIATFNQWSTAFNTFAAVYSIKYPSLAPTLLKYCKVLKDLAKRSAYWRWYDEQFRYLRQTKADSYPWEQVQWDLWFQAHPTAVLFRTTITRTIMRSTYEVTPGFKSFTMAS